MPPTTPELSTHDRLSRMIESFNYISENCGVGNKRKSRRLAVQFVSDANIIDDMITSTLRRLPETPCPNAVNAVKCYECVDTLVGLQRLLQLPGLFEGRGQDDHIREAVPILVTGGLAASGTGPVGWWAWATSAAAGKIFWPSLSS